MENPIIISNLNDFVFCPLSIYFHDIYGEQKTLLYQSQAQLNGTYVHEKVDKQQYSSSKKVLQGIDVYCDEYNIVGKIDCFDIATGILSERKAHINKIYDGYVFQVYAECLALREMGYDVKKIVIRSYDDNKNFDILLPENDGVMFAKFKKVVNDIQSFNIDEFVPVNAEKCSKCIYSDLCDRSLV